MNSRTYQVQKITSQFIYIYISFSHFLFFEIFFLFFCLPPTSLDFSIFSFLLFSCFFHVSVFFQKNLTCFFSFIFFILFIFCDFLIVFTLFIFYFFMFFYLFYFSFLFPDSAISPPILMSCSSHTEACKIRNHSWSHLSLLTTCTLTTARAL